MNQKRFEIRNIFNHQALITFVFVALGFVWLFCYVFYPNAQKNSLWSNAAQSYNQSWYYFDGDKQVEVELPVRNRKDLLPANPGDDGWVKIYKELNGQECCNSIIYFTSCHRTTASVVTPDGREQLLYSFTCENYPKWFNYIGPMCHIFDFPKDIQDGTILCISTISAHKNKQGQFSEVRIGKRSALIKFLINKNPLISVSAIIIFALAVLLLGSSAVLRKVLKKDYTLRSLGCFSLLIGCWFIEQSYLAQLIITNQFVHWLLRGLFYVSIPITMFYFLEELSGDKANKSMSVMIIIDVIIIAVSMIGLFCGICFESFYILTDIFLLVMCVYIPLYLKLFSHNGSMEKYFPSLIILAAGFALDMFYFYAGNSEIFGYSALGFMGFFITLGFIVYSSSINKIHDLTELDTLQRLAYVDYSTNVKNRTAFYNFVENFNGPEEEYCLIIFDLNDLKKINDSLGHLYGDKVIKSFSQCAVKSFVKGDIYRVGGDEFIAVLKNTNDTKVHDMIQKFEKLVREQTDVQYKYNVAYGYQFFTPKNGNDFYNAQKSADQKMYVRKSEMKQNEKLYAKRLITDN